jgi:hypothetical protein
MLAPAEVVDRMSSAERPLPRYSLFVAGDINQFPLESTQPFDRAAIEKPQEVGAFMSELSEWLRPSDLIARQTDMHLVNTRLWIDQLSRKHGKPITIDSIPDDEWEPLFSKYESFWFMGIYAPSEASKAHAKKYAYEYAPLLSGFDPDADVVASPFAIPDYSPSQQIAKDWTAWDTMVDKLHVNKKKVIVDFVPNHVALDNPWAREHPEYFIQGNVDGYNQNPYFYHPVEAADGTTHYIAHGKDPNFPEWADTLQLNYANPDLREEMKKVLLGLVEHADGVRCDMAMLVNPGTFIRTWGNFLTEDERTNMWQSDFWGEVIPAVKERARELGKDDFTFVAEAYWDKDELGQKFDYMYGKDFYDHLIRIVSDCETPRYLRDHMAYLLKPAGHSRNVLFTENHDEDRAVKRFGKEPSKAAAVLTGLMPESIFMLNQGQEQGCRIRPVMQIGRFPDEAPDAGMEKFYARLLGLKHSVLFQEGIWEMADVATDNQSMIAVKVKVPTNGIDSIGAVICTNFGNNFASGRAREIGKDEEAVVYNLTEGKLVTNPDMAREGGLYVGLLPWETQIVFFKKTEHTVFDAQQAA